MSEYIEKIKSLVKEWNPAFTLYKIKKAEDETVVVFLHSTELTTWYLSSKESDLEPLHFELHCYTDNSQDAVEITLVTKDLNMFDKTYAAKHIANRIAELNAEIGRLVLFELELAEIAKNK